MTQCTKPDVLKVQIGGGHYSKLKIQPVEFIMANNWDFCAGSILKYVTRHRDKNGAQDIKKSLHFVELRDELWHTRHDPKIVVISIGDYCKANDILPPETSALCALASWVWCNSVRSKLELQAALHNLARHRYGTVDGDGHTASAQFV
jgi:hypothetical protein